MISVDNNTFENHRTVFEKYVFVGAEGFFEVDLHWKLFQNHHLDLTFWDVHLFLSKKVIYVVKMVLRISNSI